VKHAIGIDLGGTNIKAALLDCERGSALASTTRPTRDGEFDGSLPRFAVTVREIVEELERQSPEKKLAVGLSAPGLADPGGRCIEWMPGRMFGLEKLIWADVLERPCQVLNDAHAALLGEVWIGAARGCRDCFMLTLGTGVGGAVFSGGRLLKGAIGRSGHLGHISMDARAPKDIFNTPGSLEWFLGNQTLHERCGVAYANTHALVAAMAAGEERARQHWLDYVRTLAVGIVSLVNVLDPEIVILGGGIATGAGLHLLEPLDAFMDEFEWRPGGHKVRIVPATGGEWAGAYGAVYASIVEG
jgi:glucokinase